jgi:hypothetical protein
VKKHKYQNDGEALAKLGMDGQKWATYFMQLNEGKTIGKDFDAGDALAWFCNAIMAGYYHKPKDAEGGK